MPAGQPAITCDDLPDGWEGALISLGKQGKGKVHMARALGIARSTFYELEERSKKFSDTVEVAFQEYQIWWENAGQEGMFMGGKDNPFQGGIWNFNMAARFGWSTKQEQKVEAGITVAPYEKARDNAL